jgi:hypothetical protein
MAQTQLPLRDIHIPEAIGLWPPAIGWWLLAILLPLMLYFSYKLYKYITRKTALKAVKKQIKTLKINQEFDDKQKLIELSSLMRRTAISIFPREDVASLTEEAWLVFLDRNSDSLNFNTKIGRLLVDAAYRKAPDLKALMVLFDRCENWLNQQKEPKL